MIIEVHKTNIKLLYRKNITKAHVYDSWETIITRSNTNTALNCTKRGLPAHLRQQPMVDELLCEYKTGSIRKFELHFLELHLQY